MYSFMSTECDEQSLYYDSMKFSFPFDFISSKEVLLSNFFDSYNIICR
jgi:hypothetical protein